MELVRNLPASMAAPRVARPWVGLAAKGRIPDAAVDRTRELAGALLVHAASRLDPRTTLEVRVLPRRTAVRVEVRWGTAHESDDGAGRDGRRRSWDKVRRLADACGMSQERDRSCAWAESSAA